ncbi:MAG: WG repeat-containing protein [Clostridia bacterium]|nr:WG repeat-containing protein [Clostridia bacterium]
MLCRVCKKELTQGNICSFCGEDNTPYLTEEADKASGNDKKETKRSKSGDKKTDKFRKYKLNKKKLLKLIGIIAAIIVVIVLCKGIFKDEEKKLQTGTKKDTLFSSGMLGVRVNGEWGFVNSDDKSIFAIAPQFTHVSNYHGEVAAVCIDGKFSLIDKAGNLLCEPVFEAVGTFSDNGYVAVKKDGFWGYVDENADYIVEAKFSTAYEFAQNKMAAVSVSGSYGFIGEDGEYTIAPQYDRAQSFTADNLAAVKTGDKWGYIDDTGSAVIEPKFEEAFPFENGYAVIKQYGLYGLIDTEGNVVIKPQFDDRFSFSGDYATVKVGNKYGVIDKTGTYVINPSYPALGSFGEDGLTYAKRGDGKVGFINTKDEFSIDPQFEDARDFCMGVAPIKENGLWGYIDTDGNIIIDAKYLYASEFYSDGYAYVKNVDNTISVIDTEGNVVILDSDAEIGSVLK